MNRSYKLITFDVYTALFDIESSLVPALTGALGDQADSRALLRTWRGKQLEYALISNSLQRERVSFRVVTQRALDYALGRAQFETPETMREALVEAWNHLRPWPEAEHVLASVKSRGYPIGVLSNGDEAMLRALMATLSTPMDHFFASDQAGYYKPHPGIYRLPLQTLGLAAGEALHVAGSPTDVMGAKSAGLPCAWSNRSAELVLDPACKPDYEFQNLSGLLTIL